MTRHHGAYEPVPKSEDHDVLATRIFNHHSPFSYHNLFSARLSRILRRIGIAAFIGGVFLFGFLYSQVNVSLPDVYDLAASHREHLATPLDAHEVIYSNTTTAYLIGEHHPVSGEFPLDYQWVDPFSREPFNKTLMTNGMNNNAMARMPAGSPYDMMVIGRGRSDGYMDEVEGKQYANLTLVGFFVNYEPTSGAWIRAGPEPYILDIPIWRQYPRPCKNLVNGGPADPRLIWSDAGEPLAIIGTSSQAPGVCKAVAMVDLRAVWPGLKRHLRRAGYGDIPIRFENFTEIAKVGTRAQYEKNWSAFFSGPRPSTPNITTSRNWMKTKFERGKSVWPYFSTQIWNRTIVEVNSLTVGPNDTVMAEPINLKVINATTNATSIASSSCIIESLPSDWKPDKLHLATPFYRVTFCPRETCEPSRMNTVLLGLIHYKQSSRSYKRMFVTMKVDPPFDILSVSPPLHFGSVEFDDDVVFSVSMAFLPTKKSMYMLGDSPFGSSTDQPGGWLAHGWLDDTIVIGAGLRDALYDAIHIPVSTALQGHTLCK